MFVVITHYDQLLISLSESWHVPLLTLLANLFNSPFIWGAVCLMCVLGIRKLSLPIFLPYLYGFIVQMAAVYLLKVLIARPRPFKAIASLQVKVAHEPSTFSFPSAHTANAAFLAALLAYMYPQYRWWFYVGAALLGLLRIYSGVHYASDVIVGYIVGLLLFVITQKIIQRKF